jgi:hypothetical protein
LFYIIQFPSIGWNFAISPDVYYYTQ